jgi:hypothetical protein
MLTWSPEGRESKGIHKVMWEREVERVMKQKNLTPRDAAKW